MNLLPSREIILRGLTVCPLLYVGQLWQLILAHDPRTPAKRKEGKRAFDKWAKAKRRQISELLKELVEKKELGTFEKGCGYVHEPIVTDGPLLRVEPGRAIECMEETHARLSTALKDARGPDKPRIGYYRPLEFQRPEFRNPFYLRSISYADQVGTDYRDGGITEALRIGSVYVSQVLFNSTEASTFKLLDRPPIDGPVLDPHAQVVRKDGTTILYAVDGRLVKKLEELSRRQESCGEWLELWL